MCVSMRNAINQTISLQWVRGKTIVALARKMQSKTVDSSTSGEDVSDLAIGLIVVPGRLA